MTTQVANPVADPAAEPGAGPRADPAAAPSARRRTSTRRRLSGRRALVVLVVLMLLVGAAAVMGLRRDGSTRGEGEATTTSTTTARVRQQDLVVTETVTGQLGFDDARDLATFRSGVVTRAASEGTTVRSGAVVYAVNREPMVLLTGDEPAYRALSTASADGADVQQLERALVALGYGDGVSVDRRYTAATADAVREWEDDLGRADPDGTVSLADVVFAPGPVRVSAQQAPPGTQVQSGSTVLTVTSTTPIVSVDLDAGRADEVAVADRVDLDLPNGTSSTGTVSRIGAAESGGSASGSASSPGAGGQGSGATEGDPTFPVEVALRDPAKAKNLTGGDVEVSFETSRQEDALTVPVAALVALSEGGYAVEVAGDAGQASASGGSATRLLPVEVGTISDDTAAITGDGVRDGLVVVVPR
ncbi:MAG: peptidoglycan-binding protein [Angustibacter sp.]